MIKQSKMAIGHRVCGLLSAAMLFAVSPTLVGATEVSANLEQVSNEVSSKIIPVQALLDSIPNGLVIPKMTSEVYMNWSRSIIYPKSARANNIQGVAIVNMVVSPEGKVTGASIFKSSGNKEIDEEVLRVVNSTEGLIGGTLNGKPVSTNALASFVFELEGLDSKPQRDINSPYLVCELRCKALPGKKKLGLSDNEVQVDTTATFLLTDEQLMQPIPEGLVIPAMPDSIKNFRTKVEPSLDLYPKELLKKGIQGIVIVKLTVSPDGKVTEASVFKSSGQKEFDKAAVDFYDSADGLIGGTYKGRPVTTNLLVSFVFGCHDWKEMPKVDIESPFYTDFGVRMNVKQEYYEKLK